MVKCMDPKIQYELKNQEEGKAQVCDKVITK